MDCPGDITGDTLRDPAEQAGAATAPGSATALTDVHGLIRGWSEGARQMLGHECAEAVGRGAGDLLGGGIADTVEEVLATRREWDGSVKARHRDGRYLRVGLRAYPSINEDGTANLWLVLSEDQSTENRTALVDLAFDQAPLPMAIYDPGTRSQRMNQAASHEAAGSVSLANGPFQRTLDTDSALRAAPDGHSRVTATGDALDYEVTLPSVADSSERTWAVSTARLTDSADRVRGEISAAFDITDQYTTRQRLALLNDAGARIGTTLDVTRTAQELTDVAVSGLADFASVNLLRSVQLGQEPTPGPLTGNVTLRRVAHQSILKGCPEAAVAIGDVDTYPSLSPVAQCLATGAPVLPRQDDPDYIRWLDQDSSRASHGRAAGIHSVMVVPLRARGITMGVAFFARHRNRIPFSDDDLLLAAELAARAAVCVDNARRFTRERTANLALQRSLLPRRLPDQTAVDAATRYLPTGSHAGVGGDWFDVIPLSGARVALVVGDVVGHGVHASATMGRLRTAVRTLADVDLTPDELLTRLDDLVIRLSAESDTATGEADASAGDAMGATCLYAVYDPISRRCTMARAGHPPPLIVTPDGRGTVVDLPACPPLGLGGFPFEATELLLPAGSLLALYTDGLVESRDRDIQEGIDGLLGILSDTGASIEAMCDTAVRTLLPGRPFDDATLLLARTHALDADHVAAWDIPDDPALVSRAREQASRQLTAWGLQELACVTELIVSELVTNAIRYAHAPIQLRLIKDRTLICEVSDAGNTAPHPRYARTFDEGGRGLMLVSQLTDRWGTRQHLEGKTIWAEQALPRDR